MSNQDLRVVGYVLRVTPYKESDAIITLIAQNEGTLSFKARSIFKATNKNSAGCQLYTYGEYNLIRSKNSDQLVLKSAIALKSVAALFNDLKASMLLALVAESILRIEDYEPEVAFKIMDTYFQHLLKENNFLTAVLILLKMNMLYLGILLEANSCVNCGTKRGITSVNYQYGGFLCRGCATKFSAKPANEQYLKTFRYVMLAEVENINDFKIDELVGHQLLRDFALFLENSSGIRFKSLSLITSSLKIHLL